MKGGRGDKKVGQFVGSTPPLAPPPTRANLYTQVFKIYLMVFGCNLLIKVRLPSASSLKLGSSLAFGMTAWNLFSGCETGVGGLSRPPPSHTQDLLKNLSYRAIARYLTGIKPLPLLVTPEREFFLMM